VNTLIMGCISEECARDMNYEEQVEMASGLM
jgi:hypothetical protein